MLNFSFFKGPITNVKPHIDMSIVQAFEMIRGDVYKEVVTRLRETEDKNIRSVLKKSLDYFCFSGTFKKRSVPGLIRHSGILSMDFDGMTTRQINDVSTQLRDIPFVLGFFVSPSGNGLKVFFKIDGGQHAVCFDLLNVWFADRFALPVDEGVRDVSRACFVSWDPEAFLNVECEVFSPKKILLNNEGVAPVAASGKKGRAAKVEGPEGDPAGDGTGEKKPEKERKKRSLPEIKHDLDRVLYCVEQIEARGVDITDNDYEARMEVGFALSTLGEDARELYHRAVQYNDAYSPQDADYKFDEALKNCRFTSPAKFFKLCYLHDVKIKKPRSIAQAKAVSEAKDIIGDEEGATSYEAYGIWLNENSQTYWGLDLKNIPRELSNFKMRILFHVATSDEEAYRLIQIKNIFGLDKVIRINTDDFVSAGTFKKVIARKGNFLWKGQDFDLVRLQDMLQREEKPTFMVDVLGWNKRGKFYAWANGIYDATMNKFIPVDDYGIVEHEFDGKPQNYFIPAMSKIFADKDDLYTNDKKFKLVDGKVGFDKWAALFVRVFGDNGRVGIVFYVAAIFSDVIFKAAGQRFPLLFVYGKRGSGKGTMIQSLMRLFGEGQDQIMLGGASTVVGFMRKLAQYCNALVWFDEYKNSLVFKIIESLKNIFDRIGYERGKKDNTFQTESTPVRSAAIISGQEMPTGEPALFTRGMLLTFGETKRTEAARSLYRQLVTMENKGISHLTVQLLKYRPLFEAEFAGVYERALRDLAVAVNNNEVDERMLGNYAVLIAVFELVVDKEIFPFSMDTFRTQCQRLLMEQFFVLRGSDDTSKFWQIVEQLAGAGIISENRHYALRNGLVELRVQDVYQHYAEALMKRRDPNILDKSTLDSYLMSDAKSFVARAKTAFGGAYKWCLQFKYVELGIDLIKGDNKLELEAKYQEMGMNVDELQGVDFNGNVAPPSPELFGDGQSLKDKAGF